MCPRTVCTSVLASVQRKTQQKFELARDAARLYWICSIMYLILIFEQLFSFFFKSEKVSKMCLYVISSKFKFEILSDYSK